MDEVANIAETLTTAQKWFVTALSRAWTLPGDIGANPNHGSNRNSKLIEISKESEGREYRLTPLGLQVRAYLQAPRP